MKDKNNNEWYHKSQYGLTVFLSFVFLRIYKQESLYSYGTLFCDLDYFLKSYWSPII